MALNEHYKKELVTSFEFSTSQEAWENLNEMFLLGDENLFSTGLLSPGMAVAYNVFIKIRRTYLNPDFDFGKLFNYHITKWNLLLNNYVDLNALDLLRSKVRYFVNNKRYSYSFTYHFENNHSSGKGCLIALTVSRKYTDDIPTLTLLLRSSEITKRLAFDMILVQRMAEYIFGNNECMLNIFASQMYANIETLIMYDAHKDIQKILKKSNNDDWKQLILGKYLKMKKGKPEEFSKYKVFFRSYKVLRRDLYPYKSLLANQLVLDDDTIEYPENCISLKDRRDYKKKYLKKQKK